MATALLYTLIPVCAIGLGAVFALYRKPSVALTSVAQHFAAGLVVAAVALELLPTMVEGHHMGAVSLGFLLGVVAMMFVGRIGERTEAGTATGGSAGGSLGLIAGVGVDMLVDGLLVGAGFAVGQEQGLLLTVALTLEVSFLALSTAASQRKAGAGRSRVAGTAIVLALLLFLGSVIGVSVLSALGGAIQVAALSFGCAALLYLVTEELLTEAHQTPDAWYTTPMFFLGFLVILLLEMSAG